MVNRIVKFFDNLRFSKYPWKRIGSFSIGHNFAVISPECISIGDDFYAEDNLHLQAWKTFREQHFNPQIKIGKKVVMMGNCHISCCGNVSIGDGCLLGDNVMITDNFHGDNSENLLSISPHERPLYYKGDVFIGKNVWIGRNACIMPGVTVGDGAIIGANAVVTHDVNPKTTVAGVPAKLI